MGKAKATSRCQRGPPLPADFLDQRRIVIRGTVDPGGHRICLQPIWILPPGDLADLLPVRQLGVQPLPPALGIDHDRLSVVDEGEGWRHRFGQNRAAGFRPLSRRLPDTREEHDLVPVGIPRADLVRLLADSVMRRSYQTLTGPRSTAASVFLFDPTKTRVYPESVRSHPPPI